MFKCLLILFLICSPLWTKPIETFYGACEVEEPVLLELIESPAFQRLKHIHQYGVAYYTTHREEYSRYDHSLGVFYLLRAKKCSLEEQIAGLLHDVSHTAFSHVGDWIFNRQNQEVDYQTLTHTGYLEQSGLGEILNKYGYCTEEILPKQELFPALEQPLPTLCADRLDYNIQGAFHRGYITREEAIHLFHEIQFIDGEWISNELEILKKLVRYSLFMTQDCWGAGTNYVLSMWLADAILRGIDVGILDMEEVRFGTDSEIWTRLLISEDPLIRKHMHMILNPFHYHGFVDKKDADLFVVCKFRGIDPLVLVNGKRVRLTTTDPNLEKEFQLAKMRMANGWAIQFQ